MSYGPKWYAGKDYSGSPSFAIPDDLRPLIGHYRSQSIWGGEARVFVLHGRLVLSDAPTHAHRGKPFRLGEQRWIPDTVEFLAIADGKAHLMKMVGMDFWGIEVP